VGLAALVGAALNFVATSTAFEGLALKQIPMLGMRSATLMTFPHFGQVV
jgi:hypothetical protein